MIDVFKIGVSIGLTNNVSQVLRVIQRDLFGLNKTVDLTTGKFSAMKAAAVGAMAAVAGGAALKGMLDLVHAGEKVNEQLAKMKMAGYSSASIAANAAAAAKAAVTVPGTTWSGNLSTLSLLRATLQNSAEARAALVPVAKAQFAASVLGMGREDFQSLLKGLDIKGSFVKNGKLDAATLGKALNEAVAVVGMSHGLLTGKALFQFVRMAGPAASTIGTERFLRDFVEIMQTVGRTAGRGSLYMWKTFVGGGLSKAEADALERNGLVKGPISETGGHYALKPGQLVGYDYLVKRGIIDWTYKYLLPTLAKKGITDPAAIAAAISTDPATVQRLITFLVTNQAQVAKGRVQAAEAMRVDQYAVAQTNSPGAQMKDFTQAWNGFLEALGKPLVRTAYENLGMLTKRLLELEGWALRNPQLVGDVGRIVALVGVAAVGFAAFAVGGAAASALGLLTGAGGLLAVSAGLVALGVGLKSLPGWLIKLVQIAANTAGGAGVGAAFAGPPGAAAGAVVGFGMSLSPSGPSVHDRLAAAADAKYGHGNWHWHFDWLWGNTPVPDGGAGVPGQTYRSNGAHGDGATPVYVVNPHDIGHAVNKGLRTPAARTPSLPTPNVSAWAPGLIPISP